MDLADETAEIIEKACAESTKSLNKNAASVLTRMGRFDLLRAINTLAKRLVDWNAECDRRLYRLMCYIWSTFSYRQVGWVANLLTFCHWRISDTLR